MGLLLVSIHAILLMCTGCLQLTCPQMITEGNETDRLALLTFKQLITRDPFGSLSSWNDSLHFCEWQGIRCNPWLLRVTVLNLQGQGLLGSVSPSIGNLTFLKVINLRNNSFHGGIPEEVGRLFQLEELSLNNNTFDGQIPKNLSHCINLMVMDLSYNHFTGEIPIGISSLGKLEALSFAVNNLQGRIPESFGNLSSLQQLYLLSNSFEGSIPDEIGQLTRLTAFHIGGNKLSGMIPSSIYNLSSIKIFSTARNQLYGGLPLDIGSTLHNLQWFGISENAFFGPIPNSLANASGLQILDLSRNSFSGQVPADLGDLMGLQKLNLEINHMGSGIANDLSFITSLTNCSSLEDISLSGNNFGGPLPNSIVNLSIQLRGLRLEGNQIYGSIPVGLGNLINLIVLAMGGNSLTRNIPSSLSKLQKLQILSLSENMISGQIPSFIGNNITQLSALHLGANRLGGSIPASLKNCNRLQQLYLSANDLTGDIPKQIMDLSSLLQLGLGQNALSGALPLEVGKLQNLWFLEVSNNNLFGGIPSTLGRCLNLMELYMNGNLFQGTIPQSLSTLEGIQYLDLSHNNLSGSIPKYLGNFTQLQLLNLSFNNLEGETPMEGIFRNSSAISVRGNSKLCGGISALELPPCEIKDTKKHKRSSTFIVVITTTIATATIFLIIIILAVALLQYQLRKSRRKPAVVLVPSLGKSHWKVTYRELLQATGGFSSTNLIGEGSYGSVYKGLFHEETDATIVAVKVLNLQEQGASKSFMSECEALRNIRHRSLVKILTSCSSMDNEGKDFKALVYEFMPNGSLENWLHLQATKQEQIPSRFLSLHQRLDIAMDVASALSYLHHDCKPTIVHCDLKPSNVLLDEDMCAHVSDFGLARILSQIFNPLQASQTVSSTLGTIGYAAPEYGMGGQVSTHGDVYSYGILLLEMFTGKRPTDNMFTNGLNLHNFAKMALPEKLPDIVDPMLLSCEEDNEEIEPADEDPTCSNLETRSREEDKVRSCLVSVLKIGVSCSVELARGRMDMRDVVKGLRLSKETLTGVTIH